MNKIKIYGIFIPILISIVVSPFHVTNAVSNDTSTPKTFLDCYTSYTSFFMLSNMIMPMTVDLNDPKLKPFLTNLCNFFHEKTGVWVGINDLGNYQVNIQEFFDKYGMDSLPDSLKTAMNEYINMKDGNMSEIN